jgi:hypothetical protein
VRSLMLAVLAVLLAGCATGPAFVEAPAPQSGKALVYIYREPNFAAGARNAAFYVDGQKVFDLMAGGYSYVYVTPGRHAISQKWPYWPFDMGAIRDAVGITMDVNAGETRYAQFSSGVGAANCSPCIAIEWRIEEVPALTGHEKIATEKFTPPAVASVGGQ